MIPEKLAREVAVTVLGWTKGRGGYWFRPDRSGLGYANDKFLVRDLSGWQGIDLVVEAMTSDGWQILVHVHDTKHATVRFNKTFPDGRQIGASAVLLPYDVAVLTAAKYAKAEEAALEGEGE